MTESKSGTSPGTPVRRWQIRLLAALFLLGAAAVPVALFLRPRNPAESRPSPSWKPLYTAEHATYLERVKPLLHSKCVSCHGPERRQGGLRLDAAPEILKGGRHGAAVVAGKPERSLLVQRLTAAGDERMPKEGPALSPDEIQVLRRWIEDGAKAPDEPVPSPLARHWAFQTPRLPELPKDVPAEWKNHPIDAFLAQEYGRKALRPVPPMDPGRLLRRVSLDLTGLPPTLDELQAFLKDPSPDAYVRAVDRLLDSPRYGERWARHWMDVWRYRDEDYRVNDKGQPILVEWGSMFLWRWRDWIIESLNGDKGLDRMIQEMVAGDELDSESQSVRAAAGLLVRSYYEHSREIFLTDIVDHLPRAFLGISLNCARCHDHRFDPITQQEYYQFRAFFELVSLKDRSTLPPGATALVAPLTVTGTIDLQKDLQTYLLERGDPKQPVTDKPLLPGVPQVLQSAPLVQASPAAGIVSSGRRLSLANWMIDPRNPLTARVAVNHIWARHFGTGLVSTLSEFGVRGTPPTHPALLDWLAVEFPRHGWKQKWLHRLIVTSRAYQLHSAQGAESEANLRRDPENRCLWRYPSHRVETEVLRDSLLSLAGRLDGRLGGRSEKPEDAESSPRRSLYFRTCRAEPVAFVCQFDPPSMDECYGRSVSILPQQALAMMNSEFVWRQAEAIASRIGTASGNFIETAFLLILCRPPTALERARTEEFLAGGSSETDARLRTYVVHALLNHNDFIHLR